MSTRTVKGSTPAARSAEGTEARRVLDLPSSRRRLGGEFSVEHAAEKLSSAFYLHHQLMRAIAGKLIGVAEFEIKIELAHHLFQHADAAQALRERLDGLRVPRSRVEGRAPEHVEIMLAELMQAEDTAEFVAGLHVVLAKRLADFERDYIDRTDGLVDLPTKRILGRVLADLDEMVRWGNDVVDAYVRAGASRQSLDDWCRHLGRLIDNLGGMDGLEKRAPAPSGLRSQSKAPFRRSIRCARDQRFTTFHHTRNYKTDDQSATRAREEIGFAEDRLEVIRVQRDELDAIETFANVLYDLDGAPFEFQMVLARFIWDEARHSEMGQQGLQQLGYEPFDVPCGIIGINVRSPLPPLLAFAQINTFGELNQVGHLKRVSAEAYRVGDAATGRAIDFIHADEMLHVREGRRWLKRLLAESGTSLAQFEEEARQRAIQRLHEEGVLNEDYGLDLTALQLAEMLGE